MRARSTLRPPLPVRRLAPFLAAGAASLICAPSALANFWVPKSGGSPNADNIDSLYKIILYVAAVVFVLVAGALLTAVYRFRAHKHPVAEQIHGNTRLEIGWTAGAAGILVILTIVTFVKLGGILNPPNSDSGAVATGSSASVPGPGASGVLSASLTAPTPPNGRHLTICVQGRQFLWRYVYGNGCNKDYYGLGSNSGRQLPYSYTEMEAPVGVTVDLLVQSSDVIHAWWIPSLGGKVDAVPGYTTYTWFKAEHPGLFHGQCAQLCGRQHAFMVAEVHAVPVAQYNAWIAQQKQLIHDGNDQVSQLRKDLEKQGSLTSNGIF